MKALTLQRPWVAAFLLPTDPKRIENRKWKPPASIIGKRLALHSGLGWLPDKQSPAGCLTSADEVASWTRSFELTGVFATAVVSSFRTKRSVNSDDITHSRWWLGPYAWVLTDFVSFEPIPCKGAQGLWNLPEDVMARIPENAR